MEAVASVSQILHKSQREAGIPDCDISLRSIPKEYRIPMEISQGIMDIQINIRERITPEHHRKGQIGIRNKNLSFQRTDCTPC